MSVGFTVAFFTSIRDKNRGNNKAFVLKTLNSDMNASSMRAEHLQEKCPYIE